VEPRAQSLLRLFAEKIASSEEVIYPASGVNRTVRRTYAIVTNCEAQSGIVELERLGDLVRLTFSENELLALLDGAGEDSLKVWGESLSDEEAAARFLSMYLMESLDTREPAASDWWKFDGHGFRPGRP
jgi:hypothetical protein